MLPTCSLPTGLADTFRQTTCRQTGDQTGRCYERSWWDSETETGPCPYRCRVDRETLAHSHPTSSTDRSHSEISTLNTHTHTPPVDCLSNASVKLVSGGWWVALAFLPKLVVRLVRVDNLYDSLGIVKGKQNLVQTGVSLSLLVAKWTIQLINIPQWAFSENKRLTIREQW